MAFKERKFSEPVYQEEHIEEKKLVLISCEGRNTEPEYFELLKRKQGKKISNIIEVDIIPNLGSGSNPQDVLRNLELHINDKYQFRSNFDSLWLVLDREKVDDRKAHILSIIPDCNEKGYKIAVSNPTFELWLLIHVAKLSDYDEQLLFENNFETPAKNRRFMEKQLSEILGGYSKKAGKFPSRILDEGNLERALEQGVALNKPIDKLIDELGTNLPDLINSLQFEKLTEIR